MTNAESNHQLPPSILSLNLLTPLECEQTVTTIERLKSWWIPQKPGLPFYSLGSGSYFHAGASQLLENSYHTQLKQYNPLLQKHFAWFYRRLAETLARYLDAPICYPEHLALPGFHIILAHPTFERPLADIHLDLQHQQHQWHDGYHRQHISFTLAVQLPQFGAGMNYWNLHYDELEGRSLGEMKQMTQTRQKQFFPYQLGKLVLHSGLFAHQIAPFVEIQPDDLRITLQGHGTCDRGVWHLYW